MLIGVQISIPNLKSIGNMQNITVFDYRYRNPNSIGVKQASAFLLNDGRIVKRDYYATSQ
jgi:hypothetical protein